MSRIGSVGGFGNRPSFRMQNLRHLWRYRQLIPKLLRNYSKVILGKRVLRGVEFAITYQCNLSCPHCLKTTVEKPEGKELTTDEVLDAARDLEKLGAIFINYTGGEPILREDIYEIVQKTSAIGGLIVSLASNGLGLNEEKIRKLKKAGLSTLVLSLDGASAVTHDAFRGRKGTFDQVIKSIGYAKAAGLSVWLTGVATETNLMSGEVDRMVALAHKLGCIITLNLPYDVGEWTDQTVRLTPVGYNKYLDILRLPNVRWEGSSNWIMEGCPAGIEKIYITSYGDVFPCAVIQKSFGNIHGQSLENIYHRLASNRLYCTCRKPCLVAEKPISSDVKSVGR